MKHLNQKEVATTMAANFKHFPLTNALIEGLKRIEICTPVRANFRKEVV